MSDKPLPIVLVSHALPDGWLTRIEDHCELIIGPPEGDQLVEELAASLHLAEGIFSLLTINIDDNRIGFIMAATSYSIGPIVSGRIVSKMNITPTKALGFVVIIHIIAVMGFILMMFLGCPQGDWAGDVTLDRLDF